MFFQPFGNSHFRQISFRNSHDKFKLFFFCRPDIVTIDPEEKSHCFKTRSLVSIDERVISDDGMTHGRGFVENIRIKLLAAKRRLRTVDCRFKESLIPQARVTAA